MLSTGKWFQFMLIISDYYTINLDIGSISDQFNGIIHRELLPPSQALGLASSCQESLIHRYLVRSTNTSCEVRCQKATVISCQWPHLWHPTLHLLRAMCNAWYFAGCPLQDPAHGGNMDLQLCLKYIYLLSMDVCMSVCLYVSIYVCLSVCLPTCLPACLPACMHVCMHACI